jgi:hypothetical protein
MPVQTAHELLYDEHANPAGKGVGDGDGSGVTPGGLGGVGRGVG